jgi:hypothetical protein
MGKNSAPMGDDATSAPDRDSGTATFSGDGCIDVSGVVVDAVPSAIPATMPGGKRRHSLLPRLGSTKGSPDSLCARNDSGANRAIAACGAVPT